MTVDLLSESNERTNHSGEPTYIISVIYGVRVVYKLYRKVRREFLWDTIREPLVNLNPLSSMETGMSVIYVSRDT